MLAANLENDVAIVKNEIITANKGISELEEKMNERTITADKVIYGTITLTKWFDHYHEDNKRREEILRDTSEKFARQSKGVQEMMYEARKSLDDNTSKNK
jgi:hypothetical protein